MPFSSGNDLRLTDFLQCGFRAERHDYWPKSKARIFSGGGFLQQKKLTPTGWEIHQQRETNGIGEHTYRERGKTWERGNFSNPNPDQKGVTEMMHY